MIHVLDIEAGAYTPHPVHGAERVWNQINCGIDLWIEVVHALSGDPIPALGCVLSSSFTGRQWTFVKPTHEDLRDLYGISVSELNVWLPLIEHVEDALRGGQLVAWEVDSYWLPDTEGTSYRTDHVKSTIIVNRLDVAARRAEYFHNSGYFTLEGLDFDGIFGINERRQSMLPPYAEMVRIDSVPQECADRALRSIGEHLRRRPGGNPVAELADGVRAEVDCIAEKGLDRFHLWAFGTLRQCGGSAELAADVSRYLSDRGVRGADAATRDFLSVAQAAKSVQFQLARAARGRQVSVDAQLADMADGWHNAMEQLTASMR